jgi:hypothetical protein
MNLQCHHIFGGTANRKKSEQYGLKVWLCYEHHLGKEGVHYNKKMMDYLHRIGQMKFEETHTRENFRQEFGKSYL